MFNCALIDIIYFPKPLFANMYLYIIHFLTIKKNVFIESYTFRCQRIVSFYHRLAIGVYYNLKSFIFLLTIESKIHILLDYNIQYLCNNLYYLQVYKLYAYISFDTQ